MRAIVQHTTITEVQNTEVQQLIRDYHAIMHDVIGPAVIVNSNYENVLVYQDELRDPMKSKNEAYSGFDKYVDEAFDCTSAETDADMHYQYISAELQLQNKDAIKHMERVRQILCDVDGNPGGNGKYSVWADHTEYENKVDMLSRVVSL